MTNKTIRISILGIATAIINFSFIPTNTCRGKQHLKDYFHWKANASSPIIMAHRVAPLQAYPENAVSTLQYTFSKFPCAIEEMDVRMSSDSVLLMLHDSTLDRTTTGKGPMNKMPYTEIQKLQLKDANGKVLREKIPQLKDMLRNAKGKCILALDVKPGTNVEKVMQNVITYKMEDEVFLILYSLPDAIKFNIKYPTMMMAIGFNSMENIAAIEKSGLPYENLIALTPIILQEKAFYDKIHSMGIMTSASMFGNIDRYPKEKAIETYKEAWARGGDIICTDSLHNVAKLFN